MVHERQIRVWMLKRGIRIQDVAQSVGLHRTYVSHFLAGRKKAPAIRAWFKEHGCPVRYLGEGKKEAA